MKLSILFRATYKDGKTIRKSNKDMIMTIGILVPLAGWKVVMGEETLESEGLLWVWEC